jgi:hypothetical protein
MYDDPIYARVINLILIFFLLICFRTNARHGVCGCPSVVAQYFYCATPSSGVDASVIVVNMFVKLYIYSNQERQYVIDEIGFVCQPCSVRQSFELD